MSPLKIGHPKRKGSSSSHHFSGAMSVFGRVSFLKVPGTACPKPCGELRWTCASPPLQGAAAAGVEDFLFVWLVLFPRLFQHTFGTHPEQPLPIGYKGIPFTIGCAGFFGVCSRGVLQFSWILVMSKVADFVPEKHLRKPSATDGTFRWIQILVKPGGWRPDSRPNLQA